MSRQTYPTQLRDHLGNEIRLPSKPFAVGGEGAVFDVVGRPDLVAKLYSKPQSKDRCDKLRAMAKLCNADLLKIAAWPTSTLSNGTAGAIDGILMPRILEHLEIHHLYSVAQRKKDFPEVDWGFLLHTARNCAIAFESIHRHGHVVGDVNQKNVMVSRKGLVALVDCDSFQITEGSRIYRCGVGVPEYTPPELHGKSFNSLDRTPNHDLFGLAVLVFHLLMMGRHPFSGVPLVNADIPIEKAIQEGLYAYTRNTTKLKPPPNVPPVTMLDASTLDLFERAFRSSHRPTASEWKAALDGSMKQLQRCKNDPRHSYLGVSGQCPWCQLIATARLMFFLPSQAAAAQFRLEDIELLIRKLMGAELKFNDYKRPKPHQPIQVSLPPELRAVIRPSLASHPTRPPQLPKPELSPVPPPPTLLPRPQLIPLPNAPAMRQSPPLTPHPPAPPDPPRPKLLTIPLQPAYPQLQEPPQPDPFLPRLCLVGIGTGFLVAFVAPPVGILLLMAFSAWWLILEVTKGIRQERVKNSLKETHDVECRQIDAEYAELCRPIEEANKKLIDAWTEAKMKLMAEHSKCCKIIDEKNQAEKSIVERANATRRAEYDKVRQEIDAANRIVLDEWKAENARRKSIYTSARQKIESVNRGLMDAWEAMREAREAEHDQACREVDAANRRKVAQWEAMNSPWLMLERQWREKAIQADGEIRRLEAQLYRQRTATETSFQQRKDVASKLIESHSRARKDYDTELRQAEMDSKKIQLEDYLDQALIRKAKLKALNFDRVLSLESFGIETAKDVTLLNKQKVPGIGPVLSKRLLDWRKTLVDSFQPQNFLPDSVKSRIASRYAPIMLPLAQSIQSSIKDLDFIISKHQFRESEIIEAIGTAVQELMVAEAHIQFMKIR